jgi:hypothetical protein
MSGVVHVGLLMLCITKGNKVLVSNLLMFSLTPRRLSTKDERVSRSPPAALQRLSWFHSMQMQLRLGHNCGHSHK